MKRIVHRLSIYLLLLIICFFIGMASEIFRPLPLSKEGVLVKIEPRQSARKIAYQLRQNGIPIEPNVFILLSRLLFVQERLKAGHYHFKPGCSTFQILFKIVQGKIDQQSLTVIEGWTANQMKALLNQQTGLKHDAQAMTARELLTAIGASPEDIQRGELEGLFFPDTYLYDVGKSDLIVYQHAYRLMQKNLQKIWQTRAKNLPYQTPYQLLIMASLIEKETGHNGDRLMVSSVFVNRLKRHMPLQTDPTVIYALGDRYQGKLTRQDLKVRSVYNTYLHRGLPPTPIALPGYASLWAAAHPKASTALYFVAKGNGLSDFNDTLKEHNQAVDKYLKNSSRKK